MAISEIKPKDGDGDYSHSIIYSFNITVVDNGFILNVTYHDELETQEVFHTIDSVLNRVKELFEYS